ncbi:MAG: glycosyltransferase family A protein [Formivibrio sp.]|nr:glycosyltransferase family A protein [Formivibrio sp.]
MNTDNIALSNHDSTQEPLVSVLVPSYNHQKYIIECLESINNLDYPRLELLVSDDCSTDDTYSLAEQWTQRHLNRFERTLISRQSENLGIAGNLQYLFDNAQGAYFAPIASDDMFVKPAITCRVGILQKNRNVDALFGKAEGISESGELIANAVMSKQDASIFLRLSSRKLLAARLMLMRFWPIPGPVLLIRREALCEGGSVGRLPSEIKIEDAYMHSRLAALGRLGFVDCVVARYRNTPGGIASTICRSNELVEGFVTIYRMNMRLMKGFNRIVIGNRLSRYKLQLNPEKTLFDKVNSFVLRLITVQLKAICLLLYTFMPKPSL